MVGFEVLKEKEEIGYVDAVKGCCNGGSQSGIVVALWLLIRTIHDSLSSDNQLGLTTPVESVTLGRTLHVRFLILCGIKFLLGCFILWHFANFRTRKRKSRGPFHLCTVL